MPLIFSKESLTLAFEAETVPFIMDVFVIIVGNDIVDDDDVFVVTVDNGIDDEDDDDKMVSFTIE